MTRSATDAPPGDSSAGPAPWIRASPWLAGIAVAIVCGLELAGRLLGVQLLPPFDSVAGHLKPNAAAALVLLGLSLVLLVRGGPARRVALAAVALALAIAIATLGEYALAIDLGIGTLVPDTDPTATTPGRMSVLTATSLLLVGLAIWTAAAGPRRAIASQFFAQGSFVIAAVALLGYLYGIEELYHIGAATALPVPGALAFIALSVGTMAIHPGHGTVRRLLDPGPSGQLMRALLPATTLAPVAAGLVVIVGARYNVFSLEVAIGILVIVVALILRTVLFRTVRAVEASDRARSQAADEARRSTAEAGRSADEARRVDERTRTIMATITDTIVTIDASSRILFVNPAVERMFGYPVSELLGRQLTVLMPERFRSRHEAGLRRYIESGERGIDWDGAELVGLGRDGVEFPIDVSFAEDASGGFETFTGTIRDVTARKRLETQLLQAQRLESVGRLAGGIAHDFNNVLTAIGGFAQLLLADVPPGGPASGKIRVITDATNRASALVRQLLAFSRQQILRPEVLELGDVVRGVTPMLERLIGEDIEVAVGLVEDGWPVDADRGQLEQVIVNLVVNARDAMPSGGRLTIETANVDLDEDYVETHPEVTPGPHAMLAVSDTGLGMDAATRTQIFEPFFTTKDPGSGTGLGLATVYGIVRQSGGHIWVYSEPDRGTTFRLYFPRAAGAPARLVAESRRPVSSGGAETILVTEDESTLRELVRVVLGRLGYRVLLAADAASALEIARSERIDLLVTDVVLPGRSGLELAEAMRADAAGLRVLYMSGYTAAALEDQGRFRGDVELLEKPFTPETLGVAVRRALDRQ